VTNVLRHVGASTCTVTLGFDAAARRLPVEVSDDGSGLPVDARSGVGLASMRERAEELGGACVVESLPTGGVRVQAILPCPSTDEGVRP